MLAVPDLIDLCPDELAGLSGRGLALALVALRLFDGSLERHTRFLHSPSRAVNAVPGARFLK
ncbi:MAG: hypothetical protein WA851_07755, partial [Xanthobacteraceae bacterium]